MKRTFKMRIEGEEMTVTVERQGNDLLVARDDESFTVTLLPSAAPVDQGARRNGLASEGTVSGTAPEKAPSPMRQPLPTNPQPAPAPAGAVSAPITGSIKEVLVNEGENISQGDRVMMMEAMKMDIEILAPSAGRLSHIYVKAGDSVKEHQALFSIE